MLKNIEFQLCIEQPIPTIYGPSDYRDFRKQLEQINHLLSYTRLEEEFFLSVLKPTDNPERRVPFLRMAFRSMILLNLTNESYRGLAFRLADSELFRWFIGVSLFTGLKPPSKSTIQRIEKLLPKESIAVLIDRLNEQVFDSSNSEELLNSSTPLDCSHVYADSTCIQSSIHHPVDWLLFRDAICTIVKSIERIREQGLRHRIKNPQFFLSAINKLSIAMSQSRRSRNAKKNRKQIFRRMKKLLKAVHTHANRYYSLLEQNWELTQWSRKETDQILYRIASVTKQIPQIIDLAHTRIISEKPVKNENKILSLYEQDVHVIKRGKMNNAVEFGNGFYLAEQIDGVIVDWEYMQRQPKSDSALLKESALRIDEKYSFSSIATDRGFTSKSNDTFLEKLSKFNGTCPRDPHELTIKLADNQFVAEQRRRAQTEARIGIFKNKFIGCKLSRKGFSSRHDKILWSILTHNLWVIARKANENEKNQEEPAKQAA